jgi:hypothetical protein
MASLNPDRTLTSVNYYDMPRVDQQQQQLYGTNNPAVLNSYYNGNSFYNGGPNQLLRDPNGNLLPPGYL